MRYLVFAFFAIFVLLVGGMFILAPTSTPPVKVDPSLVSQLPAYNDEMERLIRNTREVYALRHEENWIAFWSVTSKLLWAQLALIAILLTVYIQHRRALWAKQELRLEIENDRLRLVTTDNGTFLLKLNENGHPWEWERVGGGPMPIEPGLDRFEWGTELRMFQTWMYELQDEERTREGMAKSGIITPRGWGVMTDILEAGGALSSEGRYKRPTLPPMDVEHRIKMGKWDTIIKPHGLKPSPAWSVKVSIHT
jgi:hypothetical protein